MEPQPLFDIKVSSIYNCGYGVGNFEAVSKPCDLSSRGSGVPGQRILDWIYTCEDIIRCEHNGNETVQFSAFLIGYQYRLELSLKNIMVTSDQQLIRNGNYSIHDWAKDHMPSFWLESSSSAPKVDMIPYLSLPMQPEFGWYTVFKTQYAQKKYIISSALWDAATGSEPTYGEKIFFPSSLVRREQLQTNTTDAGPNGTLSASGLIYRPEYLEASEQVPIAPFKSGRYPESLCKVTEEYRTKSSFDILASVGGLLALLQGFHILLFGRPLFWGLLGAKIITPFGLMGRFATKGFRKRLQEKYHYPMEPGNQTKSGPENDRPRPAVGIDMTQFLLDYVIDMGPASVPTHEINIESSDSEDEVSYKPVRRLGEVQGPEDTVELEWRRTESRSSNS
ncbi:unnamed protein product [Rhizoctonia solani]|uniref:Uncharacterized protein n=1 Tax=Rhizoctonia solani TaxID=456999 RepID=A0A8H3HAL2_9AGAM|nr:unnamed protein product [Rhizoctonia solani]